VRQLPAGLPLPRPRRRYAAAGASVCHDHDSIVNCHHAGVDRLPTPLPPSAIVLDGASGGRSV